MPIVELGPAAANATSLTPPNAPSPSFPRAVPVPPRPYSEWVIYFQLERHYIHQKVLGREPDGSSNLFFDPSDPSQGYRGPHLPGRYAGVRFPRKFYTSFGDGKGDRRRRHDDVISLQELSNMIKENWERADDETKEYVRVMHGLEMEEYAFLRAAYDRAVKKKHEAEEQKVEQEVEALHRPAKDETMKKKREAGEGADTEQKAERGVEAKGEAGRGTARPKGNAAVLTMHLDERDAGIAEQLYLMRRADGSFDAPKERMAESAGQEAPPNKRSKFPHDVAKARGAEHAAAADPEKNVTLSQQLNQLIQVKNAELLQGENAALASLQRGDLALLGRLEKAAASADPAAFRADAGERPASAPMGTPLAFQAFTSAQMGPDGRGVAGDAAGRGHTGGGTGICHGQQPATNDNVCHAPPTEQYANGKEAAPGGRGPRPCPPSLPAQSFAAGGRGLTVAGSGDAGARAIISGSNSRLLGNCVGSSCFAGRLSNVPLCLKQNQQGGGTDNAMKQIQDESSLNEEELRLLLLRGAKSIARDAARSLEEGRAHPCQNETKAAIKYLEGLKTSGRSAPRQSKEAPGGGRNMGGPTENADSGSGLGRLSAETRTDIATVAAAATAAGLRLLPPLDAHDGGSQDGARGGRDGGDSRPRASPPRPSSRTVARLGVVGSQPIPQSVPVPQPIRQPSPQSFQGGNSVLGVQQSMLCKEMAKKQAIPQPVPQSFQGGNSVLRLHQSMLDREIAMKQSIPQLVPQPVPQSLQGGNSVLQLQQSTLDEEMAKNQSIPQPIPQSAPQSAPQSIQGGNSVLRLQQSMVNDEMAKKQQQLREINERILMMEECKHQAAPGVGERGLAALPANLPGDGSVGHGRYSWVGGAINNAAVAQSAPASVKRASALENVIDSESRRVKVEAEEFLHVLLGANTDKLRAVKSLLGS